MVRRNFMWMLSANGCHAAAQWLIVVIIAKFGTPEVLGRFSIALAIAAPIVLFSNMHLRTLQATDARRRFAFADYRAVRRISSLCAFLAIVIVSVLWLEPAGRWLAVFVATLKLTEANVDIYYGFFQQHERMGMTAVSIFLRTAGIVLGFIPAFLITRDIAWSVAVSAAVNVLVVFAHDARKVDQLEPGASQQPPSRTRAAALVRLALPMGVVALLVSILPNVPRYFLQHYVGAAAVGYYSAMAYLLFAGTTVVVALGQAIAPRLAKHAAAGEWQSFDRLAGRAVAGVGALGLLGFLAALLAGRAILTILYAPAYARYAADFTWLMAAGTLGYMGSILWNVCTAAGRLRGQVLVYGLAIVGSLVTAALTVPALGLRGGVLACFAGACLQLLGNTLLVFSVRRAAASAPRMADVDGRQAPALASRHVVVVTGPNVLAATEQDRSC